jgi:flagellar protein FliS
MLTYSPGALGRAAAVPAVAANGGGASPQLASGVPATAAQSKAGAIGRYRSLDVEARVAAATPHGLVLMLFERLVQLVGEARGAARRGDRVARCRAIERALALVDGLDTTLDEARGGKVAATLHQAYAVLRGLLADGSEPALAEAAAMADALTDAWRRITP